MQAPPLETKESPQTVDAVGGLKASGERSGRWDDSNATNWSSWVKRTQFEACLGARGEPGDAAVGGAPGASAPLPCLQRNNSNETILAGGVYRSAFLLAQSVAGLAREYSLERLGFLTLTFADHVTEISEASRRYNSLTTGVLRKRYAKTIATVERQKSGRLHFHLVVVLPSDIRSGFDFKAAEDGAYRSANPALRGEWAFWRKTAKAYRFGRTELLPIKATAEAIGKYVGKYLAKHMGQRVEADKGARLVRYSKGARAGSTRFAWAGCKGWLWRKKLAQWAERHGYASDEALKAQFGPKWAYRLAKVIAAEAVDVYPTWEHARADGVPLVTGFWNVGQTVSSESVGALPDKFQRESLGAIGASLEETDDDTGEVVRRVRFASDCSVRVERPTLQIEEPWKVKPFGSQLETRWLRKREETPAHPRACFVTPSGDVVPVVVQRDGCGEIMHLRRERKG